MNTCGFCGTPLEGVYCCYCEMDLQEKHIVTNGQRMRQGSEFQGYPSRTKIYLSTLELMQLETIELLCLLREARAVRAEAYKLRSLRHQAEKKMGFNDEVRQLEEATYKQYADSTKKVWVIENIIKDRLGYYPEKVTDNFLNVYLDRMIKSEKKPMKMGG